MRKNIVPSLLLLALALVPPLAASDTEGVIIQCTKPCANVVAAIEALGGTVTYEYENVGAVAATVPIAERDSLLLVGGVEAVYKDVIVKSPVPSEVASIPASEIQGVLQGDELSDALADAPGNYFPFNNNLTGASAFLGAGIDGTGVIVGVIDSGTANVAAISGAVLGGENFVPGGGEPSANSTLNNPHGTWVGCMIAADIGFLFSSGSTLAQSVAAHLPGSSIPGFFPGLDLIPMVGSAPGASLYALKVFPASGGGAPESRIIQAMDRAITLRRNFNNGVPSVPVAGSGTASDPFIFDSLDLQVVNMSLGGPTLFAGRDLEDQLTEEMVDVGITLVASIGNEGFAAMTGGSPGTGLGSLTVGAASTAQHERILRDLQFGLGFGDLFRPADHIQMATFSSRGPTADGRIDPEVVANGFASFAQGASGGLSLVSGTSFSSPTTAGGAALLRQALPTASAADIRDALTASANPFVLGDDSGAIDQGEGFIDLPGALDALLSGGDTDDDSDSESDSDDDSDSDSDGFNKHVAKNVKKARLDLVKFKKDTFSTSIEDLLPGQVAHFFVESDEELDQLTISILNISPELPPVDQNVFFGDDIFFEVVDAPTSFDVLLASGFLASDTTFSVDDPQTGLIRVAIMGDWTNAGRVSADLVIERTREDEGDETLDGKVAQGALAVSSVEMPAGVADAVFELSWDENWGRYPTDDLDMFLISPSGAVTFGGATLSSPERVEFGSPEAGTWTVFVDGFTVHGVHGGPQSRWELRVTADGERLEAED